MFGWETALHVWNTRGGEEQCFTHNLPLALCFAESLFLAPISAARPLPAQLPSLLGRAQARLGRLSATLTQLDALLLTLPLFARVQLPSSELIGGDGESAAAAADGAPPQQLQLVFLHADAGMRATLSLPLLETVFMRPGRAGAGANPAASAAAPKVTVCVEAGRRAAAAGREVAEALEAAVLGVAAGPGWLQHVCVAAQETLQRSGASVNLARMDGAVSVAASEGLPGRAGGAGASGAQLKGDDRVCLGERRVLLGSVISV